MNRCTVGASGACTTALLVLLAILAPPLSTAMAQQAGSTEQPDATAQPAEAAQPVDVAEAAGMTETELDELVAPIALYPDALLAQIFVASTFPLEVVKAARWAGDNKEMPQDARGKAAEAEGWDPSVSVLAAGFPQVIDRMARDLDRTELLGDALLAQSDDVLAAVQRLRARADAVGNLPSNDAQTVTVEGDNITISPANPEVVYVPTYDSEGVYTQAASEPPMVVAPTSSDFSTGTVYVEDDDDAGALLATGLLSFGAGMLVSEMFDDDDDWGGYWGPSYGGAIGWGGGYVRPYPPGRGGIGNGIGNDVNIDIDRNRNRVNVDNDGNWRPDSDPRRDEARNNIADRRGAGDRAAQRPAGADGGRAELRQKLDAKGGGAQAREALLGGGTGAALAAGGGAAAGLAAQRRPSERQTAIGGRKGGLTGATRAAERGRESKARSSGGGKRETAGQRRGGQQISRGGGRPQAQRSSGGGRSAFNQRGGGRQAGATKSRGAKSRGGGRGGGGGGRGGGRRG